MDRPCKVLGPPHEFLAFRRASEEELEPPHADERAVFGQEVLTPRGTRLLSPRARRGIPEHQVVRALPAGGFGRVDLVKTSDGRELALKTIDVGSAAHGEMSESVRAHDIEVHAQKMKAEVKALAMLDNCPNISHLVGYELTAGGEILRIATEYVPGDSLTNLKHQLGEQLIARIARQLLKTLEDCHSKGIAHLDINPNNIILDSSNVQAKLIDFGGVRFFTPSSPIITDVRLSSKGTRHFIGKGDDVVKQDLYGIAQVLNFVLAEPHSAAAKTFIDACSNGVPIVELLTNHWLKHWSDA